MGCFDGFKWSSLEQDDKGNTTQFKYLNILYGRNYSGKTTISKIIQSLETKQPPHNYDEYDYELNVENNTYHADNLDTANLDVRVYNKDFIDKHLGFLRDTNDDVIPFAIVGGDNIKLEPLIKASEVLLGDQDEPQIDTLYGKLQSAQDSEQKAKTAHETEQKALNKKLSNKATGQKTGIKYNNTFGDATYNITKITNDLTTVGASVEKYQLSSEKINQLSKAAQETPLDKVDELKFSIPLLDQNSQKIQKLVEKQIQTNNPIQELLDDSMLQIWVKQGREHHEGKRHTCAFCANDLPDDLWTKLDAHFNAESEGLEKLLLSEKSALKQLKLSIDNFDLPKESDFYEAQKGDYNSVKTEFENSTKRYNNAIDKLIKQIEARNSSIFESLVFDDIDFTGEDFVSLRDEFNDIVKANNAHTGMIDQSIKDAKRKLILNEVALFHEDIDYEKCVSEIRLKQSEEVDTKRQTIQAQQAVNDEHDKLDGFKVQLKDETKGADKVNEYLNHHFGHAGIQLHAEQTDTQTKKFKFSIKRGHELAHNLSEGECSIIAFCYFMAKLQEPATEGKKLIIYIDDPISSLDSNHIFFIYSLISSDIVGPIGKDDNGKRLYQHNQIFISTHNLEFFKYLKQLIKISPKNQCEQFLVERESDNKSTIKRLPKYLRDYATEFNYLFEQIVKCSKASQSDPHETFYNFGNNLRKFLEAYLFYKYPSNDSDQERLRLFFGNDPQAALVSGRITNELSHLKGQFDRSMAPIEIPEIPRLATYVLDKMFKKDPEQYNALLSSIGETERKVT